VAAARCAAARACMRVARTEERGSVHRVAPTSSGRGSARWTFVSFAFRRHAVGGWCCGSRQRRQSWLLCAPQHARMPCSSLPTFTVMPIPTVCACNLCLRAHHSLAALRPPGSDRPPVMTLTQTDNARGAVMDELGPAAAEAGLGVGGLPATFKSLTAPESNASHRMHICCSRTSQSQLELWSVSVGCAACITPPARQGSVNSQHLLSRCMNLLDRDDRTAYVNLWL
jgi:hypothetical protein